MRMVGIVTRQDLVVEAAAPQGPAESAPGT
jgi:hypothetical protein